MFVSRSYFFLNHRNPPVGISLISASHTSTPPQSFQQAFIGKHKALLSGTHVMNSSFYALHAKTSNHCLFPFFITSLTFTCSYTWIISNPSFSIRGTGVLLLLVFFQTYAQEKVQSGAVCETASFLSFHHLLYSLLYIEYFRGRHQTSFRQHCCYINNMNITNNQQYRNQPSVLRNR